MTNKEIDDIMSSMNELYLNQQNIYTTEEYLIDSWERRQLSKVRDFLDNFPIMERIYPRTIGIELVNVQPMPASNLNLMFTDYTSRL